MVDTLLAAAALAAATNDLNSLVAAVEESSPRSGESVRTVVPADRRRVARATGARSTDFSELKPLLERAKVDASLAETRSLLDRVERELRNGNREQAMLTLDGATLQLQKVRPEASGSFIDSFLELERRESLLREKLGHPKFVPLRPSPLPPKQDAGPAEESAPKDDTEPVKQPLRDELPVG